MYFTKALLQGTAARRGGAKAAMDRESGAGTGMWRSRAQPVFPMMVVISSALKARIVFDRMLPRDPT